MTNLRKIIERAIREVKPQAAIRSRPTQQLYDRNVIGPRNRALLGGLGITSAGMVGYSLHKNRKRERK